MYIDIKRFFEEPKKKKNTKLDIREKRKLLY